MSYRDLTPLTFVFEPMLKTRELVRVILQIHTAGRGTYFKVSLFVPGLKLAGVIVEVQRVLLAEAQAAAHRWALSYATIEEAHLGADALKCALEQIQSPEFTVTHAIVQEIVPLTPKAPPPPPPPPSEPVPPSRGERIIGEMAETIKDLGNFTKFQKECLSAHQDLFEDEDVGGHLKNRFGTMKARIVDPEAY